MAFDRKAYMAEYNKRYYTENKDYWSKRYQDNKEDHIERSKAWSKSNKEKRNEHSQKWRDQNRQKFRESCKASTKKNMPRKLANNAKRRSVRIQRTASWADQDKIASKYKFAKFMEWITLGIPYHVDHIVPLQGKRVCGLHTQDNLQVIRADLNLKKGNKFDA